MPDGKDVYHAFFLVKLPQPVNGHYIIRAACFKKESDFRRQLKLRVVVKDTERKTECDYKYGQLFEFSTNDAKLEDYSIIVINEVAAPLFERNMLLLDSICYQMKDFTVSAAQLSTSGIYMNPVLGEMRDPMSAIWPGMMQLAEFQVVMQDENEFTYEIRDIGDMEIIDLVNSNMMEEGMVFKDRPTHYMHLNDAQYNSLKMAFNESRNLVCIQGAPGTGKTLVLAHLIAILLFNKKKAIVLTPTTKSLKKIWRTSEKVMNEMGFPYSSDTIVDIEKFGNAFKKVNENEGIERQIERGEQVMSKANFVFAQFGSAFIKKATRFNSFEPCVLIIDNGNYVSESQLLPACLQGMRMVIAGDPSQLSPIDYYEINPDPVQHKLSIMDRIINDKERFSWIQLGILYRCHADIIRWSNITFFGRLIENKFDVTNTLDRTIFNRRNTLPKLNRGPYAATVLIDTSAVTDKEERVLTYERLSEAHLPNKRTYENIGEKDIALLHYKHLRDFGIAAKEIAILTCYQGQVDLLKAGMEKYIENREIDPTCRETTIATVDSVQGLEFDCVIFSMVRSNPKLDMGIVAEPHRMNVLMTRAKRHLFFIGNGFLIGHQEEKTKIKHLLTIFRNHRFHPNHVKYILTDSDYETTNNVESYFEDFTNWTNDDSMKTDI